MKKIILALAIFFNVSLTAHAAIVQYYVEGSYTMLDTGVEHVLSGTILVDDVWQGPYTGRWYDYVGFDFTIGDVGSYMRGGIGADYSYSQWIDTLSGPGTEWFSDGTYLYGVGSDGSHVWSGDNLVERWSGDIRPSDGIYTTGEAPPLTDHMIFRGGATHYDSQVGNVISSVASINYDMYRSVPEPGTLLLLGLGLLGIVGRKAMTKA